MNYVIIKGMKMPDACGLCPCFHAENPMCCQAVKAAVQKPRIVHPYAKGRPEWCPIIEVPKHGRLIDADALLSLLDNCMFPSDMVTTTAVSMATNWIKKAPTVIEAEEGEDLPF